MSDQSPYLLFESILTASPAAHRINLMLDVNQQLLIRCHEVSETIMFRVRRVAAIQSKTGQRRFGGSR
jgi:hypothetical protein